MFRRLLQEGFESCSGSEVRRFGVSQHKVMHVNLQMKDMLGKSLPIRSAAEAVRGAGTSAYVHRRHCLLVCSFEHTLPFIHLAFCLGSDPWATHTHTAKAFNVRMHISSPRMLINLVLVHEADPPRNVESRTSAMHFSCG